MFNLVTRLLPLVDGTIKAEEAQKKLAATKRDSEKDFIVIYLSD